YTPDVIYTVVAGGVDHYHIVGRTFCNAHADVAFIAGLTLGTEAAVEGFRKYFCNARLAGPARAVEQIGMRFFIPDDGIAQCFGYVLLSDDILECLRPEGPVQSLIFHSTAPP